MQLHWGVAGEGLCPGGAWGQGCSSDQGRSLVWASVWGACASPVNVPQATLTAGWAVFALVWGQERALDLK